MPETKRLIEEHEDLIRARAYQFWEDEGRPHGRDEIHWQRALESIVTPAAKVAFAAMPKDVSSDISLIDGIGPKIAAQLAAEGISSLAQLAQMSKADLAKLDEKLGLKGRSDRDEWLSQAKELIAGKPPRAKVDRARATR
jgi:predicted flap endonuclease-1-like 5' DNA nuclease